jgi:hypothetical protein
MKATFYKQQVFGIKRDFNRLCKGQKKGLVDKYLQGPPALSAE